MVTVKIYNPGLDLPGASHFLTLRGPHLCCAYFGNHWLEIMQLPLFKWWGVQFGKKALTETSSNRTRWKLDINTKLIAHGHRLFAVAAMAIRFSVFYLLP